MVLEERVIFTSAEDAASFVAFLRKNGCPCQKTVQGIGSDREVLFGTIDQVVPWLGAEAARCEEEGEEKDAAWFRITGEYYQNARDVIREIMAEKRPGEVIFSREEIVSDITELITRTGDAGTKGEQETPRDFGRSAARSLAMVILVQNGVIHDTPEGFQLERVVPEGTLRAEFELENIPLIDLDALTGMSRKICYHYALLHVVTADPLIHLACDPDEVLDLLEDLSVPEEVLCAVADSLLAKSLLVSTLLREVEQEKSIDSNALAERLNNIELAVSELPAPACIQVDNELVTAVVAELRKRDILAGTDQKIRMAGGKKQR